MVRRNKPEVTSEPHEQIITKAIRTFQGSRCNIPRRISNRTPTTMENSRCFPRVTPYSIQRNGTTWAKLCRTATRHHRRRTRMGSRTNSSSQTLRTNQEAPVSYQMEGLLAFTRLLGKRHRRTRARSHKGILHTTTHGYTSYKTAIPRGRHRSVPIHIPTLLSNTIPMSYPTAFPANSSNLPRAVIITLGTENGAVIVRLHTSGEHLHIFSTFVNRDGMC